ncbi:MAG: hypothetical protein IJ438_13020 [Clostridia bacterium]|nr:hypothetical protein [Clostridia bacterium]
MLTRLTEQEYEQYAPWAYDLAMTAEHSSYPTYRDGIKTREDFMQRAQRAFTDETEEVLLYLHEGKVRGWIQWYTIPEECYAGTVSFLVEDHAQEAVAEFAAHVAQRMPGATLDIGMSADNRQAACALEDCGFTLLEASVNHTMFLSGHTLPAVPEAVTLVTTADEAEFRNLHDDPTMYWNADRILADAGHWRSYLYWHAGRAVGVLCCMLDDGWPEIFGIEFENDAFRPEAYCALMAACLRDAQADGCPHMTYFEEEEQALPLLAELGFTQVGRYLAYRKELKEE